MRKPRDFESELKALADKAKALKDRRVRQLGELVMATGADALDAVAMKDATTKEGWRTNGAAFFRGKQRKPARRSARDLGGASPREGDAASG